jgi:hypothetical protein
MGDYDRSSKWLIQHHGDGILRLAGAGKITRWRPLQAELVQPTQLPDGLLEVELVGRKKRVWYLIEVATYPERRVQSELKTVRLQASWRVFELWKLDAEQLLATGDPGLVPFVPLAHFEEPAEPFLERCREQINRESDIQRRKDLLVVTQVFARLRFKNRRLLEILGGRQMIHDSPVIREFVLEQAQKDILRALELRFGQVPSKIKQAVEAIQDEERVDAVFASAIQCGDLKSFERELQK